jgi:hypothetical protein
MADAQAVSPGSVGASASLCPVCSSTDLRRSHVRFYEKPRKWLTTSRPYRCGGCHARIWGSFESSSPPAVAQVAPPPAPSLDLSEIDRSLERH